MQEQYCLELVVGVFLVIFGLYEKLLDSILNFFKNVKENLKFLLPIIVGGIVGVLVVSNFLNFFLTKYPLQTKSIFIGLILGTMPSLFKSIKEKPNFKKKHYILLIVSLIIGLGLIFLEGNMTGFENSSYNSIYFFISGMIMSIGVIVPGVSSTILLMLLGVYNVYLSSLANIYFPVLIPMGIGLVIGGFICMAITKKLLERYASQTLCVILGFSLGSIFVLIPNMNGILDVFLAIFCGILGFMIASK